MSFIYRYRIALILSILKFSLPFILQDPLYELHRDEMLYIPQGNHLAWGFMEVPLLLSIFARLALSMGGSFFWIKFWPSLFGAVNLFLICLMTAEMGGKEFAQLVAGLCLIAGGYLRVHYLFQPNFLEIFFRTLSAYFIVHYINYNIKNLLFVGRRVPDKNDMVFQQFERYEVVDSIPTPFAREEGVKIILFENGNSKLNGMIEAGIKEKKDDYRR